MVIKIFLSELCIPSGSSFGTNVIVLAWHSYSMQLHEWCHLRNGDSRFAPAEIINGEKPYLGPLRNQMKRVAKLRPYFRHLCLGLDSFRLFASGCRCF